MRLGWKERLRCAGLAALVAWVTGWLISFPFELGTAWRYVDGHGRGLPAALAEGLVVWAAFSLYMALAGLLPVMLPLILLVSPAWIARWRSWMALAAGVAAFVGISGRMHLLSFYYFVHHSEVVHAFFFSAPNFFVITFAVVVVWVYSALVKRQMAGK